MADNDWGDIYDSAAQAYNVDPALLRAVVQAESSSDPNAVSPKGAIGPAQLMPATAASLGVTDATDPKQAIPAAAKLLSENLDRYGNPEDALRAYHGGTDKKNWGPLTQAYPGRVAQIYSKLKDQSSASAAPDHFSNLAASVADGTQAPPDPFSKLVNSVSSEPAAKPSPALDSWVSENARIQALPTQEEQFAADNAAIAARQAAPQPAPVTPPAPAPTLIGRLGAGVAQGAGDVGRTVVDPIAAYLDQKTGLSNIEHSLGFPTAAEANQSHTDATNAFNVAYADSPSGTLGRAAGNIIATLPALAAGGEVLAGGRALAGAAPYIGPALDAADSAIAGSKLLRIAAQGASGAVQGGAGNALISSASNEPFVDQVKSGAELGGVMGVGAPVIAKAGNAFMGAITGGGVNPTVARLAQTAESKYGIPMRGGQISESPFVKYLDSTLGSVPFTGYAEKNEAQRNAFTKAVASTFGEHADSLSPSVMKAARERMGDMFDSVAAKTTVKADGPFVSEMARIESEAPSVLEAGEFAPIKRQLDNILDKVSPADEISGEQYQAMTRKGGALDRAMSSSNPNIRYYAGQIRNALDDALERSAPPEAKEALRTARLQWKNMRTVQDLAAKAGIEGEITPNLLLGAVRKSYKDMAYSGAGDIGELAQIGQQFLKEPPNSGTANRLLVHKMLALLGGEGAAYLYDPNLALKVAAGTAGTVGAAKLMAKALDSNIYKNRLMNSALRTGPTLGARVASNPLLQGIGSYAVPSAVIGINRLQQAATP